MDSEELAAALEGTAADVLREAGCRAPPVDAFAVAARLGLQVAWDVRQAGRARFVRLGQRQMTQPQGVILLRPEPRPERRQWAVAHELGEHAAERFFTRLGLDPAAAAPAAREQAANRLASRLLLPGVWFTRDAARRGWDLAALKERYSTASYELIARRMLDFPPPVIVSIFDQGELTYRGSNQPGRPPALSPAERQCWQSVRAEGSPLLAANGATVAGMTSEGVQAWAIHEPGWQREILRTSLEG